MAIGTEMLNAACSCIKRYYADRDILPIYSFRAYLSSLPMFESLDLAEKEVAGIKRADFEEFTAACGSSFKSSFEFLYFYFLYYTQKRLSAWLIRQGLNFEMR